MISRRQFIGSATLLLSTSGSVVAQASPTRRPISGMTAADPDLAAYARGVAAMKALPTNDPRNWSRFANIHEQFCPHGNWYFLPWHRAYLASLERIIRDLSGKTDFALPYWDWTEQRGLPEAFTAGDPQTNPLNHSRAGSIQNIPLPDDMVGGNVLARIVDSPDFEAFGSTRPTGQSGPSTEWQRRPGSKTELEFNPHDGVHIAVGGDMAATATAARDPVFYLHHANIDRIWAAWNSNGNRNPDDANWLGFRFDRNFLNPDRSAWNVAVQDALSPDTLGYRYPSGAIGSIADGSNAFAAQPGADRMAQRLLAYRRLSPASSYAADHESRSISSSSFGTIQIASASVRGDASMNRPISVALRFPSSLKSLLGDGQKHRVFAQLRNCEPPQDVTTRVRVFANCPEISGSTQISDPRYCSSLAFFATNHHASHGGGEGSSFCVDITKAVMSARGGPRPDEISVQIAPDCQGGDDATTRCAPKRVEVVIL